jgi:TolB-like protein/Tfp pilus assembly protein PilF
MAAARRTGEPPIIVVTPFAVLDGDGQAEALVRVLVHDLEAALCRLPDLRVLSLKHPTPERLERVDSDAIASYQLAGSVRPSAEGLKLAVSLSEIGSGRLVWSHNVEATPGAIGAAIDLAVERIAGAMLPTVERDLMLSRRLEAASPEAHALYLRGRIGVLTARSYAEARAAADLLEQALEADPRSVNARLHLVLCYNGDFMQKIAGHDPAPWRARAMRLAQEAVNLEPGNADANARLGWCHLRLGDSARAESLLRRALELGPHHADNVEQCAIGLALLGEAKEAGDLIQRAFALNPFPRSDYFADQAIALLLQGDAAAARAMFEIGSDPSIQYLAVETACLGLLQETGQSEERLSRLRESLRAIWAGDAPPTDADLLSWLWSVLPFARPAHRALIAQGLHQSGLRPHATAASLSP